MIASDKYLIQERGATCKYYVSTNSNNFDGTGSIKGTFFATPLILAYSNKSIQIFIVQSRVVFKKS